MADNGKVRFGLSKLYYAVLTEGATNAWATPVAIPGAVSMDLENNGTDNTFYAVLQEQRKQRLHRQPGGRTDPRPDAGRRLGHDP